MTGYDTMLTCNQDYDALATNHKWLPGEWHAYKNKHIEKETKPELKVKISKECSNVFNGATAAANGLEVHEHTGCHPEVVLVQTTN